MLVGAICGGALVLGVTNSARAATFGEDLKFLSEHVETIVLTDADGHAQVAVVPAYQGRVMTSTTGGAAGPSFGFINRELIATGKFLPHMNAFGGEDRFWLGPEGGQFALFFKKGDPFDLEHWQTPAMMDTEPFELVSKTSDSATFRKEATLANYSGTEFSVRIDRQVKLIDPKRAAELLGLKDLGAKLVAYETVNTLTNTGKAAWTKDTGVLSIWILGMFNPSPQTTIMIPIVAGPESELGPKVNDTYFGKVPAERLRVEDAKLFFSGDGQYRSKIGISPRRAKPIAGSYDAGGKVLTLVQFNQPKGATDYVNSMWEIQKEPFAGDTVNSYNDGAPSPGAKPLGPFYEIESSSPAAALKPGESITHIHRTFHFQGDEAALNAISTKNLQISIKEAQTALKGK
jgi:hypothetical protein